MLFFIKKVKDCKMFWWRHDLQPFVKLDSLTWKAHCMSWNLKPKFSLDEKLRRIEDVLTTLFFSTFLLSVDAIACFNDNRRYGTSLTNHHWPDLHIWHQNLNFFYWLQHHFISGSKWIISEASFRHPDLLQRRQLRPDLHRWIVAWTTTRTKEAKGSGTRRTRRTTAPTSPCRCSTVATRTTGQTIG